MVYTYREVRGTFTALTPDTTDSDEHPNIVPLSGSVVLTPIYKDGGISFSESGHFDQPQPKPAAIDQDGILRSVVTDPVTGAISRQPLFLPVTVDERANQEWVYEASFPEVVRSDTGERVSIPTKRFAVEPGDGPLNLVAVTAMASRAATLVTRGAAGIVVSATQPTQGQVWLDPTGDGTPLATPSRDGLMSAEDKAKSDLSIAGPGRPDNPSTTGGKITGGELAGTEYRSTDGHGVGAWVWRKQSSGWQVIVGNTGWRNIPLINGYALTNQYAYLRARVTADALQIMFTGVDTSGATGTDMTKALPSGWQVAETQRGAAFDAHARGSNAHQFMVPWDARIQVAPYSPLAGKVIAAAGIHSFPKRSTEWPTTLPGTPA